MDTYELDSFTRMLSISFLERGLDREIERTRRHGESLSLVAIEIDMEKDPRTRNIFYTVFRQLAKLVIDTIRIIDLAVRIGNRIIVVLPETDKIGSALFCKRLNELFKKHNFFFDDMGDFELTLDMGIVTYPADTDNKDELIRNLDTEISSNWEEKYSEYLIKAKELTQEKAQS